ncbi:MAG TPA: GNAT family N-acetyltransferase [Meiothermus sp.]|nr:GNAT family N-acetyltransferase [Meiothermus sp.]
MIRPFTPEDHARAVEIVNANWPQDPQTLEDRLEADRRRKPDLVFERYALELNGEMVAYGQFGHIEWRMHPDKYGFDLLVHPEFQGRGLGRALYQRLLQRVMQRDPLDLRTWVREDKPAWPVVQRYGFSEVTRDWESRLNLETFDPAPFREAAARAEQEGYRLLSWAEWGDTPLHRRQLWEADHEIAEDVPHTDALTLPDLERYQQMIFGSKDFLPHTLLLAIAPNGELAGISQLWQANPPTRLHNGLTGVRRPHRRKGLALAMKLKNIEQAKARGIKEISTFNNSSNRPMLAINEALGFVKLPSWIEVVKVFRGEP